MTNLLHDEDPTRPCDPPSAPRYRSAPVEDVLPIADVNTRPEHIGATLRRVMQQLQDAADGAPGPTRERLDRAWTELRLAMVELPVEGSGGR